MEYTLYNASNQFKQANPLYYEEQDQLQNVFLDDYKRQWKDLYRLRVKYQTRNMNEISKYENTSTIQVFDTISFNLGSQCTLQCTYCYLHRFGKQEDINKQLYPFEPDQDELLSNARFIIETLIKNEYQINTIDIFGGEMFTLFGSVLTRLYTIVYELYKDQDPLLRPINIIVPTNMTWMSKPGQIELIKIYESKLQRIGIEVQYSESFDGLLELQNRQYQSQQFNSAFPRDEDYITKLFEFQSTNNAGFHPMVYSNGIEYWIDNFLWFQRMFYKFGIQPSNIYLLEVRNYEWTPEDQLEFGYFIRFLVKLNKQFQKFFGTDSHQLINEMNWNILNHLNPVTYRGIGCTLQTSISINVQSLSIQGCHRNNYAFNQLGTLDKTADDFVIVNSINPQSVFTVQSFTTTQQPKCADCLIKYSCSGLCIGSQFEVFADQYYPIPTQCMLEHVKVFSLIQSFLDEGYQQQVVECNSSTYLKEIIRYIENGFDKLIRQRDNIIDKKIEQFFQVLKTSKDDIPIFTKEEKMIFGG